jgi:ATP-dependent Clp protease adaptor protein ClpS
MNATIDNPVIEDEKIYEIKTSPRWKILFHNNEVSAMELVIGLLLKIFNYDLQKAIEKMYDIHNTDAGVVYINSKEICELKLEQAQHILQLVGDPLNITMEPDEK